MITEILPGANQKAAEAAAHIVRELGGATDHPDQPFINTGILNQIRLVLPAGSGLNFVWFTGAKPEGVPTFALSIAVDDPGVAQSRAQAIASAYQVQYAVTNGVGPLQGGAFFELDGLPWSFFFQPGASRMGGAVVSPSC